MELGWTVDRVKYYLRKMKTQELIKRVSNSHSDTVNKKKIFNDRFLKR